jgi:hypothetical protein
MEIPSWFVYPSDEKYFILSLPPETDIDLREERRAQAVGGNE